MMATVSLCGASLIPLLDSLEDTAAGQPEQTDAYLTIVNRLSGEEGQQYHAVIVKHFPRLGKAIKAHICSDNAELSQAALQTLGLCVFYPHIVAAVPANFAEETLTKLTELVVKSTEKNTCTRALWVISKQNFPADIIGKKVPAIVTALEAVRNREDIQSVVLEHEAVNVIIRLIEQAPAQMTDTAVHWVKLVVPLVIHSASKVRLRAAAALEMGLPLILEKQEDVAAVVEPMMSTKLIPELQKLFNNKNETNVLKLWTLFVKILGKVLHRGGSFINSLLYLEEMGFRSSSPSVKKIAFFAWKSLIDNFALNPEILCSAKRLKLLMLPLVSIQVKTEPLLLTKINVWWYLVVKLGPNLGTNFEQVGIALLQNTIPQEVASPSSTSASTPSRSITQRSSFALNTPKAATLASSASSPSPACQTSASFPCVQLLGLEILLHYLLGPQVPSLATKTKLQLCLEPLTHPLLTSTSFFTKHSSVFLTYVKNGFMAVGKDSPGMLLHIIWKSLVTHVCKTVEAGNSKKDRQGCEALTMLLQSLREVLLSEALPAKQTLDLLETTVKGIPKKVLGSAAYQVGDMDILNGTPALFLIRLFFDTKYLPTFVEDEKFFLSLETLLSCGLSGPTSPLAFAEAVLEAMSQDTGAVANKEHLWRMWSMVVNPLTDTVTQSNEVNQGDALEHKFSAMHSALMFPISYLLPGKPLPQMTQKTLLSSWSRLYMVFGRCSALVATAEENACCEELCGKMAAALESKAKGLELEEPPVLDAVINILHTMIESVDFSPYTPQFQQKMKSPHTPLGWIRKKNKALGNLSTFHTLLVQCLEKLLGLDLSKLAAYSSGTTLLGLGTMLFNIVSRIFSNLALPTVIQEAFSLLAQPLAQLYVLIGSTENDPRSKAYCSVLAPKLETLLADVLRSLQSRSTLQYDDDLLSVLSPLLCKVFLHKSKQIRSHTTQFWNATFANSLVLSYPETLRPILSKVKQNTPIILPGFQAVDVPEDVCGQYSSEGSQIETRISGMTVTPGNKRESLMNRAAEPKTSTTPTAKPVSVKLDFGSSKLPRREVLEEEASVDFVFIPPETKERVLTEHQKEVKRTKRVDIPAMYNNLDASLDTTTFTQYTQSQEESMDKLPADEQTAMEKDKTLPEALKENTDAAVSPAVNEDQAKDQDNGGSHMGEAEEEPTTEMDTSLQGEEVPSAPPDVSMEEDGGQEQDVSKEANVEKTPTKDDKEDGSPNVSGSSDVISGTPQKTPSSSSRRQSFITLEKYADGRAASPISVFKFTGPHVKNVDSQETPKSARNSQSSQADGLTDKDASQEHLKGASVSKDPEPSSKHTRESTEDEDFIPDTQTKVQSDNVTASDGPTLIEGKGDIETDSQSSAASSPTNPRRSGRQRTKPGEEPGEKEGKGSERETRSAANKESSVSSSQETNSQSKGRPSRRSKGAEVESVDTVKGRRSLRGLGENSQSNSQTPETDSQSSVRSRRSQTDILLASQSQSQDLPGRRTRSAPETDSQVLNGEAQSPSRPVRTTRRSETAKSQDESQSQTEQATSQSDKGVRGRPGRRRKLANDEESQNAQMESFSESQEQSQVQRGLKTRKSSQPSASVENSDTEASSQDELQKPRKRGRKLYSMNATLTHSPVKSPQVNILSDKVETPEHPVGSEDVQITEMSKSTASQESPSKASSIVTGDQMEQTATEERNDSQEEVMDTQQEDNDKSSKKEEKQQVQEVIEPAVMEAPKSSPICTDIAKEADPKSSDVIEVPAASQVLNSQSSEQEKDVNVENIHSTPDVVKPVSQGPDSQSDDCKTDSAGETSCPVHSNKKPRKRGRPKCTCHLSQNSSAVSEGESQEDDRNSEVNNLSSQSEEMTSEELKTVEDKTILPEPEISETKPDMSSPVSQPNESPAMPELPIKSEGEGAQKEEPDVEPQKNEVASEVPVEGSELVGDLVKQDDEVPPAEPVETANPDKQEENLEASVVSHTELHGNEQDVTTNDDDGVAPLGDDAPEAEEEELEVNNKEDQVPVQMETSEAAMETTGPPVAETAEPSEPLEAAADNEVFLDSPVKQKCVDAVSEAAEMVESPGSGRTRGVWSPSASPSTSILKKGLKRPIEEESPSPLLKSRRVSFADPIYQQELADDIDRRSPVIRTSSPRPKTIGGQPKFITTPTKGLLNFSPRNLRSPGYKSSKKCLISEMSQERRPIPKDCVYPALVGCSTPVEAVLPQISANMWPRGFGQLVRARNIKTVGDLSALTPTDIKALPIRSPKVSNVKKALKSYHEQQRKVRCDDLKGFDEMEKMTSEAEDLELSHNQEEEKTQAEAQEVMSEGTSISEELQVEEDQQQPPQQQGEEPQPEGLLPDIQAFGEQVARCTPDQLAGVHDHLSRMMKTVVDRLVVTAKSGMP
ncbi:telomere-associated protein RIF1 isoform X2 [Engraulis encrasicolus]|uniref:telomere-associated protein RIF1 isoform X2 n=1 Tax=Engraulis encrasicolus TaxID=184585 RepID=UPI002FD71BB4